MLLMFITKMPLITYCAKLIATVPTLLYVVAGVNGLVLLKDVIVSCASVTATVDPEVRRPDNVTVAVALTVKLPRICTLL